MAKRLEEMTEREAREELERRQHRGRRQGSLYDDGWGWDPYDTPAAGWGAGWGAPLMAPMYPGYGYAPLDPWNDWRYGRPGPRGTRGVRDNRNERDFIDRASDEVASWFGDEGAEARREADHRGKGPKGYIRSDERIEEDVHDRLTDDPEVDAREIEVGVKDREVTLNGTVDSRFTKRAAEDCADSVSGVVNVQNNLRVQPRAE